MGGDDTNRNIILAFLRVNDREDGFTSSELMHVMKVTNPNRIRPRLTELYKGFWRKGEYFSPKITKIGCRKADVPFGKVEYAFRPLSEACGRVTEENKMETQNSIIDWETATHIEESKIVQLVPEKDKVLTITNFSLRRNPKFDNKIEFFAEVLIEDGDAVSKQFSTTSKRLMQKLRPIFEKRPKEDRVTIKILKIGEGYETQYNVQLVN